MAVCSSVTVIAGRLEGHGDTAASATHVDGWAILNSQYGLGGVAQAANRGGLRQPTARHTEGHQERRAAEGLILACHPRLGSSLTTHVHLRVGPTDSVQLPRAP